jgi:tetratricopeptide (TPR) repeat protein
MVDSIIKSKNMISSDASLETKSPENTAPKFNVNVEFQMAKLWHQKGKIERAIAGYRKVLAVNPMHWSSLLALDELLTMKGEEQTAIALYRQAIQNLAVIEWTQQATIYQRNGNIEKAIEEWQKVLAVNPTHSEVLQLLESALTQQGDMRSAIAAYRAATERDPNNAEFHKRHINLIVAEQGIDAAFAYYELTRADEKTINISPRALLCCVVVRNELPRLPYFLNYYRQKGVDKFLIVDNRSTDGTLEYLLQQNDVYVWSSAKSFNQVNFGSVWFELLLRRYGIDHWCLTVDADELLYYPNCEQETIRELCQRLDKRQYRAYTAMLLDMYSDQTVQNTHYKPGEDFLEVCPYFDRQYYHRKYPQGSPYRNQTLYFGGVRERVFGRTGEYLLSKVPLLKYGLEMVMIGGQHLTNLPKSKIAQESGCLLHFKYFSLFTDYVAQEVKRQEHYGGGHQYAEYFRNLSMNSALTLYDENHSVKLESSRQLVQLGIMKVESES